MVPARPTGRPKGEDSPRRTWATKAGVAHGKEARIANNQTPLPPFPLAPGAEKSSASKPQPLG